MKRIALIYILFCWGFAAQAQWNSSGSNSTTGSIIAINPLNTQASASLSWLDNTARIRVGGNGAGAGNGLDIQGPGNTSLLRVDGAGNITAKGRVGNVNPANPQAGMSLSWLDNTARIRVGGNGAGAGNGLDIQGPGNTSLLRVRGNGRVGIGTTAPRQKLDVNGTIRAKEIRVEASPWPDYVFEKGFALPSLSTTEAFIERNGHLPGIPSAQEVEKEGIALGGMSAKLLQKIEELTLHIIAQEKRAEQQALQIMSLAQELNELKNKK